MACLSLPLMIIGVWFMACVGAYASCDSLRMERRGTLVFIVHQVDMGETVYGLSKRYGVSLADLYAHNPKLKEIGLRMGEELFVLKQRLQEVALNGKKGAQTEEVPLDKFIFHEVKAGESLYGIARLYGVHVSMIRNWNGLKGYELYVGQRLSIFRSATNPKKGLPKDTVVASFVPISKNTARVCANTHEVQAGETLYRIALNYGIALHQLMQWNDLNIRDTLRIGQLLYTSAPTQESVSKVAPTKGRVAVSPSGVSSSNLTSPSRSAAFARPFRSNQVIETGFAAPILRSEDAEQYYALHRTAEIGTLIRVKNRINNRVILVRVIGVLPDTGEHQKALIYVTQKAYAQLGNPDVTCPVEISYFSD